MVELNINLVQALPIFNSHFTYRKSRNVHEYLIFVFSANDCDSQKLHV